MKQEAMFRTMAFPLVLLLCLLFSGSIYAVFHVQHQRLVYEFDRLIQENLTDYTLHQKESSSQTILDTQTMLTDRSLLVENLGIKNVGEWLPSYLDSRRQTTSIDYFPVQELHAWSEGNPSCWLNAEETGLLLVGSSVVTDIFLSSDHVGYFYIAVPVQTGNEVTGVLRARLDANLLFDAPQPSLFQRIYSLIIKRDGAIVFTPTSKYSATGDLFRSLLDSGASTEDIEICSRLLAEQDSGFFQFSVRGNQYYASFEHLNDHDWYVLNFVRSPDVLLRTNFILRSILISGMLLILITAATCCIVLVSIWRKRSRLDLELRRYTVLSQFSDTVLFEYNSVTDTVEFTTNAQDVLFLPDGIKIKHATHPDCAGNLIPPEERTSLIHKMQAMPALCAGESRSVEVRLLCQDGVYRWFNCLYNALDTTFKASGILVGKLVDISNQRGRELHLLEQARRDVLTDTYNRSGEQVIDELLASGCPGLFFMLDLDNFKAVNDTYGHAAGDALLSEFSKCLKGLFRPEDIIARVGGDEFVVFVPYATSREIAERRAESILALLTGMRTERLNTAALTISVGISVCPRDGSTYQELYNAADRAMYSVKRSGKGSFAFYTP